LPSRMTGLTGPCALPPLPPVVKPALPPAPPLDPPAVPLALPPAAAPAAPALPLPELPDMPLVPAVGPAPEVLGSPLPASFEHAGSRLAANSAQLSSIRALRERLCRTLDVVEPSLGVTSEEA
jgi:hypothetical protein